MKHTFTIPFCSHSLTADFFAHTGAPFRGCIFYLHGGGLVFGTRDDLPSRYQLMFAENGYDLIALSYPLAPESKLSVILDAVHSSIQYVLSHPELCGYQSFPPYWLFGRSAGAYLALMEMNRLLHAVAASSEIPVPLCPPRGVLSFYGYHTFDLPEFQKPSAYYQKLPQVPVSSLDTAPAQTILTDGDLTKRYSIYIYARQTGTWLSFLGCDQAHPASYHITDEDLAAFPPCFFTASSADQDVPFRESKTLARKIPGSKFHPVYYLPHDFDRDLTNVEGVNAYEAALAWMLSSEISDSF